MTDRFSLKGRIALVTGASRGLGLAIAEALAGHGARVVLNGRDPETLRSAAAKITNAEFAAFDVCDAKAGPAAIADIVNRHGKLDILINNAG
ncbi:MAG: SDR family NAD(P)-dependent oxidoreductase, partial [Terrimicrobiaceae bacterium]